MLILPNIWYNAPCQVLGQINEIKEVIYVLRFLKRVVFSRSFMTALLIILQFAFYILVGNYFFEYSKTIQIISYALSFLLAIYVLGLKNGSLDVKLPWIIFIIIFPVFGSLFYFFFRNQKVRKKVMCNKLLHWKNTLIFGLFSIYNSLIYNFIFEFLYNDSH